MLASNTRGWFQVQSRMSNRHLYGVLGLALAVLLSVATVLMDAARQPGDLRLANELLGELRAAAPWHAAFAAITSSLFGFLGYRIGRREDRLVASALTDPLTQSPNRRHLQLRLRLELARLSRCPQPLAVLLIDVDHLKAINDQFGHAAGDELLRHVAKCLSREIRDCDFAARYGGDEFMVIAPATTVEGAVELGERIRRSLATRSFGGQPTTVSIGLADLDGEGDVDIDRFLAVVDARLYEAKRGGRDRLSLVRVGTDELREEI